MPKENKRKADVQAVKKTAKAVAPVVEEKPKTPVELYFQKIEEFKDKLGAPIYTIEERLLFPQEGEDDEDDVEVVEVDLDDEDEEIVDEEDEDEDNVDPDLVVVSANSDDEAEDDEEDADEEDEVDDEDDDEDNDGVPDDDDEDDEEVYSTVEIDEYTPEELDDLRHIIITNRRKEHLENMANAILGEEDEDDEEVDEDKIAELIKERDEKLMARVHEVVPNEIKKLSKHSLAEQFDLLHGISKTLLEFDSWINVSEPHKDNTTTIINLVGNSWKTLLTHPNEVLEIDGEYTRGGIERMLSNFESLIKHVSENELAFVWK